MPDSSQGKGRAAEAQPHRRPTRLSPSLQEDLRRLRRLSPLLVVLLVLIVVGGVARYATGLVMLPQERWSRALAIPRQYGLSPRTVSLISADGIPLKAWWEKPWAIPEPKGTVIIVHGSQMNKTGMAFQAGRLLPQGFSVMVPDLRAHGQSGGTYSTFGYKEALDVEAAVRWVRAREGNKPIALLGYSSGAVAALFAASRMPEVSAVIADSAFIDTHDVLRREAAFLRHPPPNAEVPWNHRLRLTLFTAPGFSSVVEWVFRWRAGVPFEPPEADLLAAVAKIKTAHVLYMASEHDPVVPREVTERLYRATASPNKQILFQPGAFHSALAGDVRRYLSTISAFLDDAFGTEAVPAAAAAAPNPHLR
jgi:alpha-beta hydrolase superfamily lysophospholipase